MFYDTIKKNPETLFLIKLFAFFSLFYFGTQFWIGITSKGNFYIAFCDEYLNYIKWLRLSILKAAGIFCSWFGYQTNIENTISLRVVNGDVNGYKVNMVYSCIGIGIFSSWAAFALAYSTNLKRKTIWLFGGLLAIWLINSIRMAILLIWLNKTRNTKGFGHHHTVFNIIAYTIVIILIYFYSKEKKLHSNK